ncbi:hypothetical protein HJFPF1_02318 [Paramyrothecium foliicola]|nr:hypothetical protein HJFPF1_02318 [Paramyrothecium foliicola]
MKAIILCASFILAASAYNVCNNNCGRAVAGTARASPALSARRSMCATFVSRTTTVTPPPVTVTASVIYNRNAHDRGYGKADYAEYHNGYSQNLHDKSAGEVPGYAVACPDTRAYWSACQCFNGIKATTTTVTAPAKTSTVPGPTCTQGLEYAIYGPKPNTERIRNLAEADRQGANHVDFSLQFAGVEPDVTGITYIVGTLRQTDSYSPPVRIYGQSGPAGSQMGLSIIDHRGYILPAFTGVYTVWLDDSDNALFAWVGEHAVSGWNQTNASIGRFWPPDPATSYRFTFEINRDSVGVPIPFRLLWLNSGGPGALSARVVDPQGNVILGGSSPKNPQIVTSCSGSRPLAPSWVVWSREI